jgi:hypothetical protein
MTDRGVRWTLERCFSVYGDHTHYRCVIVEAIAPKYEVAILP